MISSLLFSSYKTYIQFLPVMEMLKKSYAESLESLLLPSKNGNHFINSVENRKKKKAKKGKWLVNDYLMEKETVRLCHVS